YVNAFPPTFHGWGEAVVESKQIAGWAVNDANPGTPVEVQLFVAGKLAGTQTAQLSRPDVVVAGWSRSELCGYSFVLPSLPAGTHEARVYALHESGDAARYTLQLLGDPIRFVVNADGSWRQTN
ncbi:MAG TPA: hypothetical protein VHH35_14730, partial [Pyrinomonadaceae bacterium]|nr:hypothetical protein [Pyrinomonadaceae bacterium]